MTAWMLAPLPWRHWDQLDRGALADLRWFWCDLLGPHLDEALPASAPVATHLWGWSVSRWARLRLDRDQVVGAVLDIDMPPIPGASVAQVRELTAPFRRPAGAAGPQPDLPYTPGSLRILECLSPTQLTFVEPRDVPRRPR